MTSEAAERKVILATSNHWFRERLSSSLRSMRWEVQHVNGGAEALACLEERSFEAFIVDGWLPDLEVSSLIADMRRLYPEMDVLRMDDPLQNGQIRSPRRNELLQAFREVEPDSLTVQNSPPAGLRPTGRRLESSDTASRASRHDAGSSVSGNSSGFLEDSPEPVELIPGLVGDSLPMRELAHLIRLVASHSVRVLIEGETGTGKEVIANAIHAFSSRVSKPFIVLNCAAIPETLLEAELFGHTRGAFTGAVQSRTGRVEAANGGTLFLDEIGEMPLALQAKLLRFLENGELQRVGDNESIRVDVRVLAATHRNLDQCVEDGTFRLDLLHRLAVFPLEVPSLRDRLEDLPLLTEHILGKITQGSPRKKVSPEAFELLRSHEWPGNVRELGHVLQRAVILTENAAVIPAANIRMRRSKRA